MPALADAGGWLDVDQFSLQHKKFANVWGLGDVMNTPNAKTMAAVRKQVPVVAANIINTLKGQELQAGYDGYGSCPLTGAHSQSSVVKSYSPNLATVASFFRRSPRFYLMAHAPRGQHGY